MTLLTTDRLGSYQLEVAIAPIEYEGRVSYINLCFTGPVASPTKAYIETRMCYCEIFILNIRFFEGIKLRCLD